VALYFRTQRKGRGKGYHVCVVVGGGKRKKEGKGQGRRLVLCLCVCVEDGKVQGLLWVVVMAPSVSSLGLVVVKRNMGDVKTAAAVDAVATP
jgi:hypothetical protein